MPVEFILGLPGLSCRALLEKARELGMPAMISANALSRRVPLPLPDRPDLRARLDEEGWERFVESTRFTEWHGFNLAPLRNAVGIECHLDSAGFVAMSRYGGYEWHVDAYMELAAAHPWKRFSSMDLCVEPSIARDRTKVLDRIAGTVALNNQCRRRARELGISDRFMPVIQGYTHEDYWRCIDRMHWAAGHDVIGVGSMCTRHVRGVNGIVHIVSMLDRFLPPGVRLHLFGLKSDGAEAVRGLDHRVASVDSQAYGTEARQRANKIRTGRKRGRKICTSSASDTSDLFGGQASNPEPAGNPDFSKSNAFVASIMEEWATRQVQRLRKPGFSFQDSLPIAVGEAPLKRGSWEWAMHIARCRLRNLIQSGELEPDHMDERWVFEMAGDIYAGEDEGSDFDNDGWEHPTSETPELAA